MSRKTTLSFAIFCLLNVTLVLAQTRLSAEESDKLLIEKITPTYPGLAEATKVQGGVKLDLSVSEKGVVTSAVVIEGHPLLRAAAVAVAKQRHYKPLLINDRPTPFVTTIFVEFTSAKSMPDYARQLQINKKFFESEEKCRDLLKSGKFMEAEAACKEASQLAGQLPPQSVLEREGIHELVGHVAMRQARYEDAIASYSKALEFAQLTLTDEDAELGQLYAFLGIAHHSLHDLNKAREFYRKAEASLHLAYSKMACEHCDEEVDKIRQDYMKSLKDVINYHVLAAQQAGATAEIKELIKLRDSLPK